MENTDRYCYLLILMILYNRKGDWLNISPGWLVYLCPEIIVKLHAGGSNKDLPFSEKSDAYAFG